MAGVDLSGRSDKFEAQLTNRIPALLNPSAGSAPKVLEALENDPRFEIQKVKPDKLADALRERVAIRTPRVLISGGDGTLASAAGELIETPVEMAILPGGTLNHFAKRIGIPEELDKALEIAAEGTASSEDVGTVNDVVFLNTSSIGAYVLYVQTRDHLEKTFHLPYFVASLFAAIRMLFGLRTFSIELDVDGKSMRYETPLVYIGLAERETSGPLVGQPKAGGRRGLHVLVVRGRTRARLLAIGLSAAARGVRNLGGNPHVDSYIVERCRIELPPGQTTVASDGELKPMESELEYRLMRDALRVVLPQHDNARRER
jgi:diacylglycerol kinase family enzyme